MTIRTPDDDIDKPGWFYPPFREGWWYAGATYAKHSDFAVDWNRRTAQGGWLQDEGDPVLAAADGTVKTVTPAEGLVVLSHPGGYGSEYRHMTGITVKVGQKVTRGDRIGSIGSVGNSTSPHLHHKHLKNGKPIKMAFNGKPIATSVGNSDTQPAGWKPPAPVLVQGPPPPTTWKAAYQEAVKRWEKCREALDAQGAQTKLALDERDDARRRIKELEALPECNDVRDQVARLQGIVDGVRALVTR